jgi:hypothetical protein
MPVLYSVVLRADQRSISKSPDARYQRKNKKIQQRQYEKEWKKRRIISKVETKHMNNSRGEKYPRTSTREPCYFIKKRYWGALLYLTHT